MGLRNRSQRQRDGRDLAAFVGACSDISRTRTRICFEHCDSTDGNLEHHQQRRARNE
jgi:hypothetical protein